MPLCYSDVTYKIMIIKAAKGDVPTTNTLFNGLTTCKLLDNFNKERYSVVYSKTLKMTARNHALGGPTTGYSLQTQGGGAATGSGYLNAAVTNENIASLGNATRIVKI